MKQKYYRLDNLDKIDAQYKMLIGERSNGKSYAVKERVLQDAYNKKKQFVYLRRWVVEIKQNLVELYFSDMPIKKITKGEYTGVTVYNGSIYFCKNVDGKNIKGDCIGYVRALSQEQHYTSGAYNEVDTIIFEEFLSRDYYLPAETDKLANIVSTIARRRKITVYMIGNTINKICPYFTEWGLEHTKDQKQGTIELYHFNTLEQDDNGDPVVIVIAVEFCENSGRNSKMFFGRISNMITSGEWLTREYNRLPGRLQDYNELYHIIYVYDNLRFNLKLLSDDDGRVIWFVYPYSGDLEKENGKRIVINKWLPGYIELMSSNIVTKGFTYAVKQEIPLIDMLLSGGCVTYSDNSTGTDFNNTLKGLTNGES